MKEHFGAAVFQAFGFISGTASNIFSPQGLTGLFFTCWHTGSPSIAHMNQKGKSFASFPKVRKRRNLTHNILGDTKQRAK